MKSRDLSYISYLVSSIKSYNNRKTLNFHQTCFLNFCEHFLVKQSVWYCFEFRFIDWLLMKNCDFLYFTYVERFYRDLYYLKLFKIKMKIYKHYQNLRAQRLLVVMLVLLLAALSAQGHHSLFLSLFALFIRRAGRVSQAAVQ